MLAPYQQQKEVITQQLHAYLKLKTSSKNTSDNADPEFVDKLLTNQEKLHFFSLVELLRLDLRQELLQYSPSGDTDTAATDKSATLDEATLRIASQLETDLTSLLTSIGSLHYVSRPPRWTNPVDDFLRLLAAWLIFCIASLIFPIFFLLLRRLSTSTTDFYSPVALKFNQIICSLILKISALEVEVTDERSAEGIALMSSRRSVTCFNHSSTIDAFVLPAVSKHFTHALAKKELFVLPYFSWLMAALGAIPISRKDRDSAVSSLQLAATSVQRGQTVTISPEGTRSASGLLLPFKKGPFYLWEAMHQPESATGGGGSGSGNGELGECLLQPVLITGAFELFPPSSLFSAPGVAQVRMLEPISPSDLGGEVLSAAATRDAMASLLRRRLLQASVCPNITAASSAREDATPALPVPPRNSLTPSERMGSLVALALSLLISLSFLALLRTLLTSAPPHGLGMTGWQVFAWGGGLSLGVTAVIFGYYSLKLRRAKATTKKME